MAYSKKNIDCGKKTSEMEKKKRKKPDVGLIFKIT